MIKKAAIIILFILQLYLILQGVQHFTKLQLPFMLFIVSIAIAGIYFYSLLKAKDEQGKTALTSKQRIIGAAIGLLTIAATYSPFRKAFDSFKDYGSLSDVIPQLETLYQRFANGIFPYAPLEQYPWHPYPVYMPLNWLPVGLAGPLHCDVRWIGVLFLGIAAAFWGAYSWSAKAAWSSKLLALALPVLGVFAFLKWNDWSLAISYEVLIAAYYLILAAGLLSRNLLLITIGIIACILSRYTMVFWLPVFLVLVWWKMPKQKSFAVWVAISVAVAALYLVPFYFQQPGILTKGLAYHNHCYVDAWDGLGHPEQSTAFDEGLNFSWFIRELTSGDMARRVLVARIIQAVLMLLLVGGFLFAYKRLKKPVNFFDYSLLALYTIVLVFYMFSPLTYMYYYIPFLMLSAAICGKTLLTRTS